MSRFHVTAEAFDPNWTEADRYLPLLDADGRHWAWVWLKRNASHQDAAGKAATVRLSPDGTAYCQTTPNLDRLFWDGIFVHSDQPNEGDQNARLFWRPSVDPSVLTITAEPIAAGHPDAFDVRRFAHMVDIVRDKRGREMCLLAGGPHQIQLEVGEGTLISGPVRLRFDFGGLSNIDAKLRTVTRLVSLRKLGRFATELFPREAGAAKWIKAVQAYDGLAAGASQRDIAGVLFGERMVREEWNGRSDFLRLRIQRLLNYARRMVDGGYKRHLH
jgi:hypothetical protein